MATFGKGEYSGLVTTHLISSSAVMVHWVRSSSRLWHTIGLPQLILDHFKPENPLINNNKKFRSFESKENIHKKEVGPYHGFGY